MIITIPTTGGTIDKEYSRNAGTYNFEIGEPAIRRILASFNPHFDYEITSILSKDSLDFTEHDRQLIYETCCKAPSSHKIMITIGTDGLLKTAEKLATDKSLGDLEQRAIALVGSGVPERFKDSEAPINVGVGLGVLSVIERGIYVCMTGRAYQWDKCKKEPDGRFVDK